MSDKVVSARSWLFAPGDSERKMQKALGSEADIVLIDLEDAVAESQKPQARAMVAAFLNANTEGRARLWVRINPIQGPHALADLAAIMPAAPGGIMLPKSRGRADVERLDNYLSALEVAAGTELGGTKVMVLATETAEGMLTTGSYAGAPRVVAMSWGPDDLAAELGAISNKEEDGGYSFTYELSRSLCLVGAAIAGVAAVDTIQADFRDEEQLKKRTTAMRRAGFRGMLAIHPAQVAIINTAFSPSDTELAGAQEIVDLFAANPDAGTIGYKGEMLDRPHLARAKATLALAQLR